MNLNKADVVAEIAGEVDLPKTDVERVLNAYHSMVGKTLKQGGKISFVGFGTYQVSNRAAREGRNPRTGEALKIAAKAVPTFKAGKALKEEVNS